MQIACWFHITQCLRRKRSGKEKLQFVDDNFERILQVLRTLHYLTDPDMLPHAYALAKKELDSVEFWEWWESRGRAPGGRNEHYTHATVPAGIPLTDNALERNNRTIKEDKKYGFCGKTLPFFAGLAKVLEYVKDLANWHTRPDVYDRPADVRKKDTKEAWEAAYVAYEDLKETFVAPGAMFSLPFSKTATRDHAVRLASFATAQTWFDFSIAASVRLTTKTACSCRKYCRMGDACKHLFLVWLLTGHVPPVQFSPMRLLMKRGVKDHTGIQHDLPARVRDFKAKFSAVTQRDGAHKRERSVTPAYDVTPEKERSWVHPRPRPQNALQLLKLANGDS